MVSFPCFSNLIFYEYAKTITCSVKDVYDGDTFVGKIGNRDEVVRLLGIDAPEPGRDGFPDEPYAKRAKDEISKLLKKRVTLCIDPENKRDKYNRLLAVVFYSDNCINASLLKKGLATRLFRRNNIINFCEWEKQEVYARRKNLWIWRNISRDGVVISEIYPAPKEDERYEFLELYNLKKNPIDISGWRVGYGSIPTGTTIAGNSFLIICRVKEEDLRAAYDIPANIPIVRVSGFFLLNSYNPPSGLGINVKAKDGSIQDSLVYSLSWDNYSASKTGLSLQKVIFGKKNIGDKRDDKNWIAKEKTPGKINK